MSPEAAAREKIDALLVAAGWAFKDYKALNPGVARGIALREVPLDSGRCDYLHLVDRIPLGVIEAKNEGITLSTDSDQSAHYGESLPAFLANILPGTKKIPSTTNRPASKPFSGTSATRHPGSHRRALPASISRSYKTSSPESPNYERSAR